MPKSKAGRGRKGSTESLRPDPDPTKVGHMIQELVEMAPAIIYPLEVQIGARDWHTLLTPVNDKTAVVDVLNTEDGHLYHIMVVSSRSYINSGKSTTATEASSETTARESGS